MTTEDVFLESSYIFREPPCRGIGGNVTKKLKHKRYFLWFFQSIFCFTFLAISSICMHSQHSQTKLSHHHTEVIQSYHIQTIIPKSY